MKSISIVLQCMNSKLPCIIHDICIFYFNNYITFDLQMISDVIQQSKNISNFIYVCLYLYIYTMMYMNLHSFTVADDYCLKAINQLLIKAYNTEGQKLSNNLFTKVYVNPTRIPQRFNRSQDRSAGHSYSDLTLDHVVPLSTQTVDPNSFRDLLYLISILTVRIFNA